MRQIGPSCRLCRREGTKLFLKGDRFMKSKCAIEKKRSVPGASQRRGKLSDYGVQLRAKQKIRRYYGLSERQFKKVFSVAVRKKGITSYMLLTLLELRLDNTVSRMGLAPSKAAARQIVTHGHVRVNGRRVNIPSFTLKQGDVVELKKSDKSLALIKKNAEQTAATNVIPGWLTFDKESLKGQVIRLPGEGEIQAPANEQLVVELYSK